MNWLNDFQFGPMARVVFGADVLEGQTARVDAVLANNGYSSGHLSMKQRHQAIAFVLLLNHSPWLDDLSWAALDRASSAAIAHAASIILHRIAKALVLLGIIAPDADAATRDPFPLGPSDGVPEEWYAWYRAWRATGSRGLAPRIARHYGGYILCAGDGWPGGTLTSYRRSNGRRSWRSRCGPLCLRKPTTSSLVRWGGRTSNAGASSADA